MWTCRPTWSWRRIAPSWRRPSATCSTTPPSSHARNRHRCPREIGERGADQRPGTAVRASRRKHWSRVFERFYRSTGRGPRESGGLGWGAITKHLVQVLGGHI